MLERSQVIGIPVRWVRVKRCELLGFESHRMGVYIFMISHRIGVYIFMISHRMGAYIFMILLVS